MTYHRLMIAAALFLAAVWLKIAVPEQAGEMLDAVQVRMDTESFAIPLPEEALKWLGWN